MRQWLILLITICHFVSATHPSLRSASAGEEDRSLEKTPFPNSRVVFYVMGDAPYGNVARSTFADMLRRLDARPSFLVHLGDIHERQDECDVGHFRQAANTLLQYSARPTFVLPGDNDWYNCNHANVTFDRWKEHFYHFHHEWPQHTLQVQHQKHREENFAFVHEHVLFIGLHLLSASVTGVRDEAEWNELVHDNTVWLKKQFRQHADKESVGAIVLLGHAYPRQDLYGDFYETLVKLVRSVAPKPCLFLQGNTHKFKLDHRFPPSNLVRVVVDRGGTHDPLEVSVEPSADVPFSFTRRGLPKES